MVTAGTRKAAFLHELAATLAATERTGGDMRVGIGLSRVAEALSNAIAKFRDLRIALLTKKEILDKALAEAKVLDPHLRVINAGKGSTGSSKPVSVGSLKRKREAEKEGRAATEQEVEACAGVIFDFLKRDKSALLSVLNLMASDGDMCVAYCHLKTARAWVEHGGATREKAVAAAKATRAIGHGGSGARRRGWPLPGAVGRRRTLWPS